MASEYDDNDASWFYQEELLHQLWESKNMKLGEVSESRFIKQHDVDPPVLWTIKDASREDMAMQGQPPDMRITLGFEESDKRLVLNATNKNRLNAIFGTSDGDDISVLFGKKVVLYRDPSVEMAGKVVGAVRLRAPKPGTAKSQASAPAVEHEPPAFDDDIPF